MVGTTTAADGLRLLARHGGVVEVRMLQTKKATVSGYFDNHADLLKAIAPWDGKTTIYVTANPVNPTLVARAKNRLQEFARATTADADILRRAWFLLDFDPAKPAGVSATTGEVEAALGRRDEVVAFLREMGFPASVEAMSGNGGHALYPVDLPNDEATRQLFERALKALKVRFHDEAVHVDEAVFNAARIWKLYGTTACKGDATDDRPHRRAELQRMPAELVNVDLDLLTALAAMAPASPRTVSTPRGSAGTLPPLDLVAAFEARGWYKRALRGGKHAVTCPWQTAHSGNSGVTETCLFEPKAAGEPWGFKCQHGHCAGRTIKDAIAVLGLAPDARRNGHAAGAISAEEMAALEADPTPEEAGASRPYQFASPFPPGHFVADWIRFASTCTDAPHEYHEVMALVLLAAVTPQVKARIKFWPHGLRTNLYALLVGPSTTWRKSTATDHARRLLQRVAPQVIGPDKATPEGFGEQLAKRNGTTMLVHVDEFTGLLADLHHKPYMAGLSELLLKAYDGRDHRYARHSKRTKGGQREADEDRIEDPHLSFVGGATPTIFEPGGLSRKDLESGLLPRFVISMPLTKPPRLGLANAGEPDAEDERTLDALAERLRRVWLWCDGPARPVTFAPGTLAVLDAFAADTERRAALLAGGARAMLERTTAMVVKVAMLSAAGRPETLEDPTLAVTMADAEAAVVVARRWREDAIAFAGRVGETVFEQQITRACDILMAKGGTATRRLIARHLHLKKKEVDELQATAVDRGRIRVRSLKVQRGEPSVLWELQQ